MLITAGGSAKQHYLAAYRSSMVVVVKTQLTHSKFDDGGDALCNFFCLTCQVGSAAAKHLFGGAYIAKLPCWAACWACLIWDVPAMALIDMLGSHKVTGESALTGCAPLQGWRASCS